MKEDRIFRSNGRVHKKKKINEDPNFWSNGRAKKNE